MGDCGQTGTAVKSVSPRKRLVVVVFLLLGLAIVSLAVGVFHYVSSNLAPVSENPSAAKVMVNVPRGASTSQIAGILAQAHLIKSSSFFIWYARFNKLDGSLQSGEYAFSPAQDLMSILQRLKAGPVPVRVTIPEGYTTKQIADLLAQKGLINRDRFYSLVRSYDFNFDFLQGLSPSNLRLEGFLFPATYDIVKGTSEEQIIEMMLKRFQQELTPQIRQAIKDKGWTVSQFVTMASLIEREAEKPQDRAVISQVFQKRLQIGMPLQSCASIEFLLGQRKRVLSLKDLQINSPYNTYLHKGFPPGPIANPGEAALQAAAFPANTDYLYFVAKPDGYHAFAKTYNEQLSNQKKYLQ